MSTYARIERVRTALPGELLVLTAHEEMQRAADMAFPFAQEASFLWLTGISEAGWKLIITPDEAILVAPHRDETKVLFEGGISVDEAIARAGATRCIAHDAFEVLLKELAETHSAAYTIGDDPHKEYYSFTPNPAQATLNALLAAYFDEMKDCREVLGRLRALKTPEEIETMQRAIDSSIAGFEAAKANIRQRQYEYELEATLSYEFRARGADGHAYDPIVASGLHACTLHYGENRDTLAGKNFVLIDAGAAVDGYAADITRTWALGEPTERERAVHEAVEGAHYKIIDLIAPGVSFKDYQHGVDEIMKDALEGLGLLKDRDDTIAYRTYFPHAVSHGLGLDVHESLGGYAAFEPGMTLTVEPGIYIAEEGIGVRIEDDILVTENGSRNLSAALSTTL